MFAHLCLQSADSCRRKPRPSIAAVLSAAVMPSSIKSVSRSVQGGCNRRLPEEAWRFVVVIHVLCGLDG